MNFHLKNGFYFRRDGDDLLIVKATSFDDPGTLILRTTVADLASIVASFSPHHEQNGSFGYILEFLKDGVMYCGGCGAKLTPSMPLIPGLSIINRTVCPTCYEQKFKPIFEWGMKQGS